jgi:hypothetical protein
MICKDKKFSATNYNFFATSVLKKRGNLSPNGRPNCQQLAG